MKLENLSDQKLNELKNKLKDQISKLDAFQNAKKVQLNSAYGAMGNQYFRFYDIRLAEAVTLSGQLVIQWIAKDLNDWLNKILSTDGVDYIIASDTDSLYVTFDELIKKVYDSQKDIPAIIEYMDTLCEKKIQNIINQSCKNLSDYTNAYQNKMRMKREALSNKAIWTRKKRYVMNLYDFEGVRYEIPKLKIMGLEAVKSNTPEVCRNKIKEAIDIIMTKDNDALLDFFDKFKKEFDALPLEDIGAPTSMNGLDNYRDSRKLFRKGTPYHVKGAFIYNELIKKHNLEKKYELIKDGDKVKTLQLKEPNPTKDMVISFSDIVPPEFDIEKYIDKDAQYDKVFMKPVKAILDVIGWKSEKIFTLENLWS